MCFCYRVTGGMRVPRAAVDLQGLGTKVIRYDPLVNMVEMSKMSEETCDAVKVNVSDLLLIPPSGKHRSSWPARSSGLSWGRNPRRKGKANKNAIYFAPICPLILIPFHTLFLGGPRANRAFWSQGTSWTGNSWTKGKKLSQSEVAFMLLVRHLFLYKQPKA